MTQAAMLAVGVNVAPAGASSGSAPTREIPSLAQLSALSPAENRLLVSGTPISVLMDPSTGQILSVTTAVTTASPTISNHNVCAAGKGCYETNRTPYADQGFYGGSGSYHGDWLDRSGYTSGAYTVSACWTSGCGVEIGPGSRVTFTSDATGTSFTIY
jgi:hypothetical protein